ncbi:MAG: ABC transporter permease subunit [Verrucomicrobiales bacterium]|nr:ABC transporter permease subunit [Verrucomicrobiales bacterium]
MTPAADQRPNRPTAAVEPAPVTDRFRTARRTLLVERFMERFITIGGIGIITVVFGIFVFILWQVLPLFRAARVTELRALPLPAAEYRALALDEYGQSALLLDAQGRLTLADLAGERGLTPLPLSFGEPVEFTAARFNAARGELVLGTADGRIGVAIVTFPSHPENGRRVTTAEVQPGPLLSLGRPGYPIRDVAWGDAGEFKLAAAVQDVNGRTELHVALLTQERSLFGAGEIAVQRTERLAPPEPGDWQTVLVNGRADALVAATRDGRVCYFVRRGDALELRQTFEPFADLPERRIARMEFLLGDVTLVFCSETGDNRLFSLFVPPGGKQRLFGQTKTFPKLGDTDAAAPVLFAVSQRNKAFLVGRGREASLRYATTEAVRWEQHFPVALTHAALNSKYDRFALLDRAHTLHVFALEDPHPEASWRAFFGKVWYEGADRPKFEWQSSGGSDEFEPKLSLVPLIFGTLKGTLYAMLFAVPVALLAALYVSQFAHPHFRALFKPVMEIMASLPSVVLGFLGALWLAPLLEDRVPSVLAVLALLPAAALGFGAAWSALPMALRARVRPGFEFVAFAPVFALTVWAGWALGPVLERALFVVTDPASGARVADFRLWWPQFTGAPFEQRNSLVVGFVMGFAVIPIIFTIAEDAMSNVPATLRSGSLALGASRWQTAWRIVLPTASAGIFSALMVGLGRAVGETMIVVMATGNTPILDLNIFSGMRTLSANIAVELPEAPHQSTLYRTLFLGAMVLFVMTFLVNTIAEVLRQRLRERYKLV